MERISYENTLLDQYKKFLQKLEKMSTLLTKRQNANRQFSQENIKLGETAVVCLCDLLSAHPYFNFGQNIAQLLVYLINSNFATTRSKILKCFQEIFQIDKKFDLTLYVSMSCPYRLAVYIYLSAPSSHIRSFVDSTTSSNRNRITSMWRC